MQETCEMAPEDQVPTYAEIKRIDGKWHAIASGFLPEGDNITGLAAILSELARDGWSFVAAVDPDLVLIQRPGDYQW
jgi:hypothetical protein